MAAHGRTRATEDLDVFIRSTPENAQRVFEALANFGAPVARHGVTPQVLAAEPKDIDDIRWLEAHSK